MMENGECPECGYGSEDMGSEMDDSCETMETQNLLDLRDGLQNCMKIIDRMIVNQSKEDYNDSEESSAPVNTVIWSVQK